MSIVVLKPGLLTTVQDGGRDGFAALGVGHAGPMDEAAWRLANALVENKHDAAALEITMLGPRLLFDADAVIALTGADFDASIDDRSLAAWRPVRVRAGSTLDCMRIRHGARGYLAIAGGFAVDRVLGSRAMDVNAGLGPFAGRPLSDGDVLPVDAMPSGDRAAQSWSLDPRPWFNPDPSHPVHLIRGTHFDALDAASRAALFSREFRIGSDSNRVGYRLEGMHLKLGTPLELISEPVAFGTLQLPPGGEPIVLMAEHPTVGGYPRIGQVAAIDRPRLAQLRPGQTLRFQEIGQVEAQTRYLERERELASMVSTIHRRLAG